MTAKYYIAVEDFARGCIGPFNDLLSVIDYLTACNSTSGRVMWVMLDSEPLFEQARNSCHINIPIEGEEDGSKKST